jgi:hypothetical protein
MKLQVNPTPLLSSMYVWLSIGFLTVRLLQQGTSAITEGSPSAWDTSKVMRSSVNIMACDTIETAVAPVYLLIPMEAFLLSYD